MRKAERGRGFSAEQQCATTLGESEFGSHDGISTFDFIETTVNEVSGCKVPSQRV